MAITPTHTIKYIKLPFEINDWSSQGVIYKRNNYVKKEDKYYRCKLYHKSSDNEQVLPGVVNSIYWEEVSQDNIQQKVAELADPTWREIKDKVTTEKIQLWNQTSQLLFNGLIDFETNKISSNYLPTASESGQVQADWEQNDSNAPAYIQNKPTIPSTEGLASLASPNFTGTPTISSTPIATTAYVQNAISNIPSGGEGETVSLNLYDSAEDELYPITNFTKTETNNISGVLLNYDNNTLDGGSIFLADGIGLNTVKNSLETSIGNISTVANNASNTANGISSIANSALSTANGALTAANGKNTIYHQSGQPTGGTYTSGDTWFDTDDGYKMYTYDGSTWVAEQFDTGSLADTAITAQKIDENAVTTTKIANGAITNAKIGQAAITQAKIDNGAITSAKIADAAITNAKIADASIQSAKIANLDVSKLTGGYIDASHINASSLVVGMSQVTGLNTTLGNKANSSDVPTKTSDLTNDSSFANTTQVSAAEGRAAQTATSYITAIDSDGITVHAANNIASNYSKINADGLHIYKDGNQVASFGDSARLGKENGSHSVIDANGQRFYASNGSTQLANIGYGSGNAQSGTAIAPYYTFGTRAVNAANYANSYDPGNYSLVEGIGGIAQGYASHAEGHNCEAIGITSHAEGNSTWAIGASAHAEGDSTKASGIESHAEGNSTEATAMYSHAEGESSKATYRAAHAEGYHTKAQGHASHAGGQYTTAYTQGETVIGRLNTVESNTPGSQGTYAFVIGNGNIVSMVPSNAFAVSWTGNIYTKNDSTNYIGKVLIPAAEATSVPKTGTWTDIGPSLTLSKGSWIITASAQVPATGTSPIRKGLRIYNTTDDETITGSRVQISSEENFDQYLQTTGLVEITSTSIIKAQGWLGNTANAAVSFNVNIRAMRVG